MMFSKNLIGTFSKQKLNFQSTRIIYIANRKYTNEPNIVKSKLRDVEIPKMLIHEYMWRNLHKWHEKTALVSYETGRKYTYYEVHKKSKALARFLRKSLKLHLGDTVAVILPNIPEYAIVLLGALEAGLRITTVNPLYTSSEIHKQMKSSDARLVFTSKDLLHTVETAIKELPCLTPIIMIKTLESDSLPNGVLNFEETYEGNTDSPLDEADWEDVALLPYSSGTTGLPKAVELTHRNIVSNMVQSLAPEYRYMSDAEGSHQDVLTLYLPFFHLYGLAIVFLQGFSCGCKIITFKKFGSEAFIRSLEHKPTVVHAVPPTVLMMLNNPKITQTKNFEHIRTVLSGAAPLGATDVDRFMDKTKGRVNLLQLYGMTETSPITTLQTPKLASGVKIGGSGFLLPNIECKIVSVDDSTNKGLGPHQSGELLFRGPQNMKGYYKNEEATKQTLIENGWLRTGDIAYYDEDEHFFVTDRLKELIKVKGFQVAPAELEAVLREHPSVADAAVIGVPHEINGEAPKGFVVLKGGATTKPQQLQEYLASKVAEYKRLVGGLVVLDSIPKTASGKILRRELKSI